MSTNSGAVHIQQEGPFLVCLTTKFACTHGRTLGSPSGRAGAERLRGELDGMTEIVEDVAQRLRGLPGKARRSRQSAGRMGEEEKIGKFFCP